MSVVCDGRPRGCGIDLEAAHVVREKNIVRQETPIRNRREDFFRRDARIANLTKQNKELRETLGRKRARAADALRRIENLDARICWSCEETPK